MEQAYEPDEWDSLTGGRDEGGAMPGGDEGEYYGDDIDDGILESLAIVALAAALAVLVVWRRRRADERERERRRAEQQGGQGGQGVQRGNPAIQIVNANNGGFFPRLGDPDFPGWAVGGVGH